MPDNITIFSLNAQRLTNNNSGTRPKRLLTLIESHSFPDVVHLSEISHNFKLPSDQYVEIAHSHSLSNLKRISNTITKKKRLNQNGDANKSTNDKRNRKSRLLKEDSEQQQKTKLLKLNLQLGLTSRENQLNQKIFIKKSTYEKFKFESRTIKGAAGQPRGLLKLNVQLDNKWSSIYFTHAKASRKGGKQAMEHTLKLVSQPNTIVIGDHNFNLNKPENMQFAKSTGAQVIVPIDQHGNALPFTQKSGGLLDFLVAHETVNVTSERQTMSTANIRYPNQRNSVKGITLTDHEAAIMKISLQR